MEAEWASVDPSQQQNYNLLEGRFKQLQGKRSEGSEVTGGGHDMLCRSDQQVTDGHRGISEVVMFKSQWS